MDDGSSRIVSDLVELAVDDCLCSICTKKLKRLCSVNCSSFKAMSHFAKILRKPMTLDNKVQ